jgi:hypothetical protein
MYDRQQLSNIELLVLARLSCSEGANADELIATLQEVAPPVEIQSGRDYAVQALDELQRRSLATQPKPTKRTPNPRSHITEDGKRALRIAFGSIRGPIWRAVRQRIPVLGLEMSRSDQPSKRRRIDEVTLALLRKHFGIAQASTTAALCDALIAKKLGLAEPATLLCMRAHVLAHDLGIDHTVSSTKDLDSLAKHAANEIEKKSVDGTPSFRQVLGQRWAYRVNGAPTIVSGPRPAAELPKQAPLPLHVVPSSQAVQRSPATASDARPSATAPTRSTGPTATPADMLLTLVREAIPQIGANGRFGDEKVFVSAIWQHLEDDGRLANWSLDRFKRWLVTANRDQLIDLARADAQGDMDSRLVEESEIVDRGATFHFVVDRQALLAARGLHAR